MSGGDLQASLAAMSPIDGRYRKQLESLSQEMSEGALIHYRLQVECAWLKYLGSLAEKGVLPTTWRLTSQEEKCLQALCVQPLVTVATRIKEIEQITNHDVKAVEYFMREQLVELGASKHTLAFIHFACTSEDINNLAYALMLKHVVGKRVQVLMAEVIALLADLSQRYADVPMLARTHGQAASPTTVGKEVAVFGFRLLRQYKRLRQQAYFGKINGAVGSYNAHAFAFPEVDWLEISRIFVEEELSLSWNPLTTQIENHDYIAEICDILRLYNTISLDLVRDFWAYISLGYFQQKVAPDEVGSSTMPHKVNPIDFENAEGNYGLSSALADHFAFKLPISRLQRDLSDSTVLRSLGTMVAHHVLGQKSLLKGLGKLELHRSAVERDLQGAWEVLAEPLQTVLRAHGVVDAYEILKKKTRGQRVDKDLIDQIIAEQRELLDAATLQRLQTLTPAHYIGLGARLAADFAAAVPRQLQAP